MRAGVLHAVHAQGRVCAAASRCPPPARLLPSSPPQVFEFLAFRNDVSFWRGVKTTAGLSVRSIGMSFVTQLIILLYLADNDTSWMVLFSSGIGLVIEGWKLQKALVVNVVWRPLGGGLVVPWVDVSDKEEDAATTQTRVYDDIATRHMLTVLVPLVMGQAGYSLVYDTHKSWYSWLIGSLTSSVYLFGFAQMTPQLYINYRLKSVAAMPWKTMSYKFLNTIIDDIFSFIVKVRWLSGKGGGGGGASYRPVPIDSPHAHLTFCRVHLPAHACCHPCPSPCRCPRCTAWRASATTSSSSSTWCSGGCTRWTSRARTSLAPRRSTTRTPRRGGRGSRACCAGASWSGARGPLASPPRARRALVVAQLQRHSGDRLESIVVISYMHGHGAGMHHVHARARPRAIANAAATFANSNDSDVDASA